MRRLLLMLSILLLLFGAIPNANAAVISATNETNERVIVIFKNKADKNIVSKVKGNVRREYRNANVLSASVPKTEIKGLKDNPNILAVEQDVIVKVKSQTIDWGINKIQAPLSWNSNFTGKGVKVGVVDTGIAIHDDLSIAGGAAFTSYTTSYLDDNGHGTHVAGIIGGKNNGYGIVGVASEASIYAVKVLGSDGAGYLSDIIAGIDWCITNKMDIINLSLGSATASTALQQEVDKAYGQGILVVASAGNDGTSAGDSDTVNYPAKYSSVIAVSATDSSNNRPSFSSTGNAIEVAAPGVNIRSTYLNNQYATMSGTSMAAPFVSGNLALIKQANPGLSASQLRTKLRENVIDLGSSGKDSWFGYGLIQAPKGQVVEVTQPAPNIPIINQPITTTGPAVGVTNPISTQPVVTQPVGTMPNKQAPQISVAANKSSYSAGQRIYIKSKVKDNNGKYIPFISVKFTITSPKGTSQIVRGLTNRYGDILFGIYTYKFIPKGTYNVLAETTSYSKYSKGSANTSFQIK